MRDTGFNMVMSKFKSTLSNIATRAPFSYGSVEGLERRSIFLAYFILLFYYFYFIIIIVFLSFFLFNEKLQLRLAILKLE